MNLLEEIGGGILKTSAFLLLVELDADVVFLLNCDNIHCQNVFSLSLATNLPHSDL